MNSAQLHQQSFKNKRAKKLLNKNLKNCIKKPQTIEISEKTQSEMENDITQTEGGSPLITYSNEAKSFNIDTIVKIKRYHKEKEAPYHQIDLLPEKIAFSTNDGYSHVSEGKSSIKMCSIKKGQKQNKKLIEYVTQSLLKSKEIEFSFFKSIKEIDEINHKNGHNWPLVTQMPYYNEIAVIPMDKCKSEIGRLTEFFGANEIIKGIVV